MEIWFMTNWQTSQLARPSCCIGRSTLCTCCPAGAARTRPRSQSARHSTIKNENINNKNEKSLFMTKLKDEKNGPMTINVWFINSTENILIIKWTFTHDWSPLFFTLRLPLFRVCAGTQLWGAALCDVTSPLMGVSFQFLRTVASLRREKLSRPPCCGPSLSREASMSACSSQRGVHRYFQE